MASSPHSDNIDMKTPAVIDDEFAVLGKAMSLAKDHCVRDS